MSPIQDDEYVLDVSGGLFVTITASEYLPATQSTHALAAAAEYLKAAQLVHVPAAVAPIAAEYMPATQFPHVFHAAPGSEVSTPARMDA